jgi:hypothetical protein
MNTLVSLQDPELGPTPKGRHVAMGLPVDGNRVIFPAQQGFDKWADPDHFDESRWQRCHTLVADCGAERCALERRELVVVHIFWLPRRFTDFHAHGPVTGDGDGRRINGLTAVVAEVTGAFERPYWPVDPYAEPAKQLQESISKLTKRLAQARETPAPGPADPGPADPGPADPGPAAVYPHWSICSVLPWCCSGSRCEPCGR